MAGISVVNEKELGKAISDNLAPRLVEAQNRLESWAGSLLYALLSGNEFHLTVSLGGQTVEVTISATPKP